jgi:hypothetical protein
LLRWPLRKSKSFWALEAIHSLRWVDLFSAGSYSARGHIRILIWTTACGKAGKTEITPIE